MSLLDGGTSNPATGETATALTLAQAAERIAAKSAEPEPRERPTAQAEDDDQADSQTDGGEPDEGEAPADGEGEDGEETADSGEDEDDAQERPPLDLTQKVKVKIDGEEREVSLSEALAGYQRLSNYTRGKQELAREREAHAEEVRVAGEERQAVVQERQHLASLANAYRTQLLGSIPTEAQLAHLKQTNPTQFLIAMEDIRGKMARVQAVEADIGQVNARTEQERRQARAKAAAKSHEALAKDITEWGEPTTRQALQNEMVTMIRGFGYEDHEISEITDARLVRFALSAMRDRKDAEAYRKLQARNPRTEQRVAEAPRVARPGAAVSTKAVAAGQLRDLQKRLEKTGSVKDAAALIAAKTARK